MPTANQVAAARRNALRGGRPGPPLPVQADEFIAHMREVAGQVISYQVGPTLHRHLTGGGYPPDVVACADLMRRPRTSWLLLARAGERTQERVTNSLADIRMDGVDMMPTTGDA